MGHFNSSKSITRYQSTDNTIDKTTPITYNVTIKDGANNEKYVFSPFYNCW